MEAEILRVEGLHKSFDGKSVIKGISFRMNRGDILGVRGASGAGKSTLALLLSGLLTPDSGRILFEGEDMSGGINPLCGLVFQDSFSALNPAHTARWFIEEALLNTQFHKKRGFTPDGREGEIERVAERVGLDRKSLAAKPRRLSGGQRARAQLAAAIIRRPRLLICDEITSALDLSVTARIVNLLRELNRDSGLSLIMISHNEKLLRYMAPRILTV